jgi:putative toxin-antitoxin system antitoxin component (TIGR02293 family)
VSHRPKPEPDQSERVVRVDKAIAFAKRVFGDRVSALRWLHAPKDRFDGRTPFELLATAEGGQRVEEELVAIDEGYVA